MVAANAIAAVNGEISRTLKNADANPVNASDAGGGQLVVPLNGDKGAGHHGEESDHRHGSPDDRQCAGAQAHLGDEAQRLGL